MHLSRSSAKRAPGESSRRGMCSLPTLSFGLNSAVTPGSWESLRLFEKLTVSLEDRLTVVLPMRAVISSREGANFLGLTEVSPQYNLLCLQSIACRWVRGNQSARPSPGETCHCPVVLRKYSSTPTRTLRVGTPALAKAASNEGQLATLAESLG